MGLGFREKLKEILEDVHWNGDPECAESGLTPEQGVSAILKLIREEEDSRVSEKSMTQELSDEGLRSLMSAWYNSIDYPASFLKDKDQETLFKLLKQVRRETLEQAAVMAEGYYYKGTVGWQRVQKVVTAIRALEGR